MLRCALLGSKPKSSTSQSLLAKNTVIKVMEGDGMIYGLCKTRHFAIISLPHNLFFKSSLNAKNG